MEGGSTELDIHSEARIHRGAADHKEVRNCAVSEPGGVSGGGGVHTRPDIRAICVLATTFFIVNFSFTALETWVQPLSLRV